MVDKSKLLRHYKNKYYILFSKNGFTKELEEAASKTNNTQLVDLRKLYYRAIQGNGGMAA